MKLLTATVAILCVITVGAQTSFTVHFGFDQFHLSPGAKKSLDSFLMERKGGLSSISLELNGYCDPAGTDDYNKVLSLKRVLSVKEYLLSHGMTKINISRTEGHGENGQLNENKTKREQRLNRRVEISIAKEEKISLLKGDQSESLLEKIADTATKAGTTIVLKNINFYGGTPFPLPESFDTMDELLQTMKVNYHLVIEIRGHICCIPGPGDSEYRETGNGLSEERARTIYAYLTGNGIEESRVSYKGFGHSMPVYAYPEKTEEERVANRRVEIVIIRK